MPRAWLLLVCAIAGCGGGGDSGPADQPAAPAAAPASDASVTGRGVDAAVVAGDQGAPCLARPRASFHLRERPVVASSGPEYPAGTELEVLGGTEVTRGAGRLLRVRVRRDGRIGHAFVLPRELAGGCPIVWQNDCHDAAPGAATPAQLAVGREAELVATLDVDRDQRADRLMRVPDGDGEDALVLMRQRADGWRAEVLVADHFEDRWSWSFATIDAGPARYLVISGSYYYGELAAPGQDGEREVDDNHARAHLVLRQRPGAGLELVFDGAPDVEQGDPEWTFAAADGESLWLVAGVARQRLHWNASGFCLRPETPP